jgi:hypothetical protein
LHCDAPSLRIMHQIEERTFSTTTSKNTAQQARMIATETVPQPCTKRCKTLRALAKCMVEIKPPIKT